MVRDSEFEGSMDFHHWTVPEWRTGKTDCSCYLVAGVRTQAGIAKTGKLVESAVVDKQLALVVDWDSRR